MRLGEAVEGLAGEGCQTKLGLEGGVGDSEEYLHFLVSSALPQSTEVLSP